MPSREAVLAWLEENPKHNGKREVARVFGLKGQQRIALKAILKELEAEGAIKRHGKRFAKPGTLPSVKVVLARLRLGIFVTG